MDPLTFLFFRKMMCDWNIPRAHGDGVLQLSLGIAQESFPPRHVLPKSLHSVPHQLRIRGVYE